MELKRYVLLASNLIVDTSIKSERYDGKCDWVILDNLLLNDDITKDPRIYLAITDHDMFEIIAVIKKTSDNILDLVEVGDCVEYNNANSNSVKIEVLFITQYNFEAWNNYCLKSSVVSLWKRNGNTMTRYEVLNDTVR